jgi:hypothetical protein
VDKAETSDGASRPRLWTELKAATPRRSAPQGPNAPQAPMSRSPAVPARRAVVQVANGSNLILDPDLDTIMEPIRSCRPASGADTTWR